MTDEIQIQIDPHSMAAPVEMLANNIKLPPELLLLLPVFYYQDGGEFATNWQKLPYHLNGWLLGLNQALTQLESPLSLAHINQLESYLPRSDQNSSYSDTCQLVLYQGSTAYSTFLDSPVPPEWENIQSSLKKTLIMKEDYWNKQNVCILKNDRDLCVQLALDTFNKLVLSSLSRDRIFTHIYYLTGYLELLKQSIGFSASSLLFFQLLIRHQIPVLPLLTGNDLWSSSLKSLHARIAKPDYTVEQADLAGEKMGKFIHKLSESDWPSYLSWAVISATPLHNALLPLLLKHSCAKTNRISDPAFLTFASYYGNQFAVEQLLGTGVFTPEHEKGHYFSALDWARQLGHENIVSLLESFTSSALVGTSSALAATSSAGSRQINLYDSCHAMFYQPRSNQASKALKWLDKYQYAYRDKQEDAYFLARTYIALRTVGNIIPDWPEKLALCIQLLNALKNTFDFSLPSRIDPEFSEWSSRLDLLIDVEPVVTRIFQNIEIIRSYKSAAAYLAQNPENTTQSFVERYNVKRTYCNLLLFKSSEITRPDVPRDAERTTILFQEILAKKQRNFFFEFFYTTVPFALNSDDEQQYLYSCFFKYIHLNQQARASLFRLLFDPNHSRDPSEKHQFTEKLYSLIWNEYLGELMDYLDKRQGDDFSTTLSRVIRYVGAQRRHMLFLGMLIKTNNLDRKASVTNVYLNTIEQGELEGLSKTALGYCRTQIRQQIASYANRFYIFFPVENQDRHRPRTGIDKQKLIAFLHGIFNHYLSGHEKEHATTHMLELANQISLFSKTGSVLYSSHNKDWDGQFFTDLFQPFLSAEEQSDLWLRAILHSSSSLRYGQKLNDPWLAFLQEHRGTLAAFATRQTNPAVTEQFTTIHFTLSKDEKDGGINSLMTLARSVVEQNSSFSSENILAWTVKYLKTSIKMIPFHEQFSKKEIESILIDPIKARANEDNRRAINELNVLFQVMLRFDYTQQESFYHKVFNHDGLSELLIQAFAMIDFKCYEQSVLFASPGIKLFAQHLFADDTLTMKSKLLFYSRCPQYLQALFLPYTEALIEKGNEEAVNKMIELMRSFSSLNLEKVVSYMILLKPENRIFFLIVTLKWCHKNTPNFFGEVSAVPHTDFWRSQGPKMNLINSILSVVQPNEWIMLQQHLTDADLEFRGWLKRMFYRHDEMKMALKAEYPIAESSAPLI